MGAHLLLLLAGNSHYLYLFRFELFVIARVRRLHEENVIDCFWWLFLQAGHVKLGLVGIGRH